jgi:hypothetical protein
MKKRIIWKMFVLEIVTLGIYRLYWLIKTRKEMMVTNPSVKIKSPWFLMLPIILIVGALILFITSAVMQGSRNSNCPIPATSPSIYNSQTNNSCQNSGSSNDVNFPHSAGVNVFSLISIILLYLAFPLALVFYVIWLWGYCHGVEIVTKEKISFAIALVILILVPDGIDILIIQDSFNKLVDNAAGTPSQPLPPAETPAPPTNPEPPAAPTPPAPLAPVQFKLA